jgi:hypothetical protein
MQQLAGGGYDPRQLPPSGKRRFLATSEDALMLLVRERDAATSQDVHDRAGSLAGLALTDSGFSPRDLALTDSGFSPRGLA